MTSVNYSVFVLLVAKLHMATYQGLVLQNSMACADISLEVMSFISTRGFPLTVVDLIDAVLMYYRQWLLPMSRDKIA